MIIWPNYTAFQHMNLSDLLDMVVGSAMVWALATSEPEGY